MNKNLFLVVLMTTTLAASPQEKNYSAQTFIQKALDASFTLRQSHLKVQQRQAELAHKNVWENPDLSVQFDDRLGDSMKLTGIEVAQKLPTYGASKNRHGQNQAFLNRAEFNNIQMRLDTQYRAAILYYELYYATTASSVVTKQYMEIEKLLNIAQAREDAGEISGVIQARIKIAKAELFSTKMRLQQEADKLHNNAQYLLQTQEKIVPTKLLKLPRELKQLNINASAQIQALHEEVKAGSYTLLLEQSKRYPLPELFAYKEREEGVQNDVEEIYGVGLRFSLPLWNQNRASIERVRLHRQQARLSLKEAQSQLSYTWQQQREHFKQLIRQIQQHTEMILLPAKKFYETQMLLFRSGESSLLEVLDAQALYADAQLRQNTLQKTRDIYQLIMMQTASIALVKETK